MKKVVYLLFAVILAVIFIQAGYYFFFVNRKSATFVTQTINRDIVITSTPTPVISFAGDIIYQKSDDPTGRSILYSNQAYPHPGVGEFFYDSQGKLLRSPKIIGSFKDWEPVADSKDRYMMLEDPIRKTILHKVRIAFAKSALFDGGISPTSLYVENLTTHKIESTGQWLLLLSSADIKNLLHVGDAMIIHPLVDTKNQLEVDTNGAVLAGRLTVRRLDGKRQLAI